MAGAERPRSASFVEDDSCSNPTVNHTLGELLSRRKALQATFSAAVLAAAGARAGDLPPGGRQTPRESAGPSSLTFPEVEHGNSLRAVVPAGYEMQVLLRWGDPLFANQRPLVPVQQTADDQLRQFGYNCDYIAFLPLPVSADGAPGGLLCVNHEYTNTNLMFPGISDSGCLETLSRVRVNCEMAAHGHSVCEIRQRGGRWEVETKSCLNRRISALNTRITASGPAAGHPRLQTAADPSGREILGTLNNCAGGVTPWGTMLICEENFNYYFSGDPTKTPEQWNHRRYGIDGPSRYSPAWAAHHPRFDVEQEPNEPNRFGWVVEFDPMDPNSTPVKRTALGRMKHEGAGIVVNPDGRVVVYCGDDERFEYIYRFVTRRAYDPKNRENNRDLLDEGQLSAARLDDDGTLVWRPLEYGVGPLNEKNGFHSQADVLIEARRAADLVGATRMDRPEDVEASPKTGHVFVMLSNNDKRTPEQINAANPRAANEHGHILELIPPSAGTRGKQLDHTADRFRWETFLRAGNPRRPADRAEYPGEVSENGWFSAPDNVAFDPDGRLWLTTDSDHELTGFGDGIYACDTEGPGRGLTRQFFRGPRGSEVSGVCLTPDAKTLFVSVQHPGQGEGSDYQTPSTRWPDFRADMPPRPAVVAITKRGGGKIGT